MALTFAEDDGSWEVGQCEGGLSEAQGRWLLNETAELFCLSIYQIELLTSESDALFAWWFFLEGFDLIVISDVGPNKFRI